MCSSGLIQKQSEYTACGPDELTGEALGIARSHEDFANALRLVFSGNEKEDGPGVIDHRPGEGDAPGIELRHVVGGDQAAHLVDGRGVGKERGAVAIRAHAEGDEVKARALGAFEAETVAQLRLIA